MALPGAQHLERCFARKEKLYMACRDGRHYFSRGRSGGNRATRVGEVFRSKVSLRESYLKISRDPLGTFLWWRDLKLFQIEADPPAKVVCSRKFVFVSN